MVVTAIYTAKPGNEAALRKIIYATARESWKESGISKYSVNEVQDRAGRFLLVAVFDSREAFNSHLNTNHVKEIVAALDELTDGTSQVFEGDSVLTSEHIKSLL